ncbi:leukotoxin LktA family filamentous adhesin [Denitromonas halophila]|uniref:leukotoxin LktA family filamentous adhesin n=1 Tax=Denitromonas halophila TaxID=1629404 RepID=UPI001642A316|nr:leukotoxin LktA family filamentous adhesin [Denitromonas halophila]
MSQGALTYLRRQYLCVLRRCAFLNAFSSWLLLAAPMAMAGQPGIVTDGRTATTLTQAGAVTDITTATVRGNNAFNSFSRFNIGSGQTVNLHLPQQTANLLNLVRNERSQIDGVMNAYKDGRIGGNVFFFNPHGMVVGAQGQINVGSLTVATPTPAYMERLIGPGGAIDDAAVDQALRGEIPLSESGLITVKGSVKAARAVQLAAANVSIDGGARIEAGAAAHAGFGALVNIDGLEAGAQMLQDGDTVRIVAADAVNIAGAVSADGASGEAAGRIRIDAGGDITVADGGRVSADGRGANSDGGKIRVWAEETATLATGGELSARGGEVSGDGGHIEFSATETVKLEGGALKANATAGKRGAVLIDPNNIEVVSANQHTDGADFTLIANDKITVGNNITISTRDIANPTTGNHATDASQGDSGDLTLRAANVELKAGSRLLAHADSGRTGGDVKVEGRSLDAIGANRDVTASVSLTEATVTGKDITIRSSAETSLVNELLENNPALTVADAQRQIDQELDDPIDGIGGAFLSVTTKATATTTVLGSKVTGSGKVTISSHAGARSGFEKTATATTTIGDSGAIKSEIRGNTIDITSTATTSLVYQILGTATKLLDQSWLPDPDGPLITALDDNLFDFNSVPLVALSTAKATTLVDGATLIIGTDTVTIGADADSAAKPTFSSPFLFSAAWGESTAEARARVVGTANVTATNALTVQAHTNTEIDVTATVNSINKPVDATFVRANTSITTIAEVGDSTTTTGGSISVDAQTEAEINAAADAKNTGGSGVGLSLAISETTSTTTATLGGTAEATTGDVSVTANADIEEGNSANAATLGNPSSISAKITNFKAGIQRNVVGGILTATGKINPATADRLTSFLFPGIKEGKFNAAGAVAWSTGNNTATASIAPLADVKAAGGISVTAKITDDPSSSAGAKTSSTGSAVGGSVAYGSFVNTANAFIGKGATVDAKGALRVDAQTHVPYPWQIDWEDPDEILSFLTGGVLDMFLTTYSINSAKGKSGIGLAVGVNLFDLDNNATAYIDEGAQINTRYTAIPGLATQSVKVSAKNDISLTGAVGILSKKFLGTSGGKAALGGSAGLISIDTNASATIRGNAKVNSANAVDVDATNIQRVITVTEAGGSSDAVGVEGAVSINTLTNTSTAAIDDDATVAAGDDITVNAKGDLENISVAGGVVATKGQVGIGFSVSVNTIVSDVAAYIGNFDPLGLDLVPALGNISTTGKVNLVAASEVSQGAYSVAGALATDSKAQTDMPAGASDTQDGGGSGTASKSGKGKFGVAVSADVSINDVTADTQAYVSDGATIAAATALDLDATNTLALSALSGAVTISTQQSGNALAGSYAQNSLAGTTAAYADDATLTLSGPLTADAKTTGTIETLSASIAGTKGKVGVAGSVSINAIDNSTKTYLSNVLLTGVSTVGLTALDDSTIRAIAGAIAFGGKAGIGLSFSWNQLDNDTESWIANSDVDATGLVSVAATTDNSIDTISAAIGASKGPMAGAAAVTINTIDNSTKTWIAGTRGGDGVDSAANIALQSTDSSRIFGLAGALGATTGSAGVGVTFAWNDVDNIVDARLKNNANAESTAGDVTVKADSSTHIEGISAAGGVSGKAGVAGAGTVVQAKNTVKASIDAGSTAIADGNIHVGAADDVDLFSLAGNVAGGGKAGIGASASVLITDNTVEARIDGSATGRGKRAAIDVPTGDKNSAGALLTESTRGVAVTATSHEDIETIAAGGSGGGSAGVAGSATVTDLTETTTAAIGSGASINPLDDGSSTQDVTVRASDETTLLGVAGAVAFGGSGGVGAGADVGLIGKTTTASVAGNVKANDTVTVEARSEEDITSVAASLSAGGSAGIAGSASVYVVDVTTKSEIADGAIVHSDGNVVVSADDDNEIDMIAGNGAFGGSAGVGASAAVAVLTKTVTARVGTGATVDALGTKAGVTIANGSFNAATYTANGTDEGEISAPAGNNPDGSDSAALTGQRVASRGTTTGFQGLAVTATNKDDVETISATGAAAGSAAITLAGDVNVITTTTTAEIANNAQINQNTGAAAGQSVLVGAGNDHYQMGIAGSASGAGAVGIGAAADVLVAKHTTTAKVGDSADIRARKDVSIEAHGQEEILSIAAGLGVGGTVGVAGSTSVLSLTNVTSATTGTGSVVDADGNVRIIATDDTETDVVDGTLAVGLGAAGVGGAVGVTRIEKDTTAGVGAGATVNARGNNTASMQALSGNDLTDRDAITGLMVEANSSEDLFSVAASGAGGFYAGVSGAVTVTSVDSDTTAVIGNGALINQGVTNGSSTQDVNVSAKNHAKLDAYTGSLAGGAVGAAGGVDVGTVKNDTTALIDNNAQVSARRDVDVNALTSADIDSITVSAAGGIGAIAGGISVYSVGSGLDAEGRKKLKSDSGDFADVNSYADDQASDGSINSLLAGSDDARIRDAGSQSQAARAGVSISGDLAGANTDGTTATIGDANVTTTTGAIDVDARQDVNIKVLAGGASVGGVGLGVGVGVVAVNAGTAADVAALATLNSGGAISAHAHTKTVSDLTGFAGSYGGIAIDAALAFVTDNSTTRAAIGDGVQIVDATGVSVSASDDRSAESEAVGVSVGGAAAVGASVATATINGATTASAGNNLQVGQSVGTVDSLSITANSSTTAKAKTIAGKAGIGLAASGSVATANNLPSVSATLGTNGRITVADTVTVGATGTTRTDANAIGVNVSAGVGIGASLATATTHSDVTSLVGANSVITARALSLDATRNTSGPGTTAYATGAAGGLLFAGSVTKAEAESLGTTTAQVGDGSTLDIADTVHVGATQSTRQRADTTGITGGAIAAGGTASWAHSNNTTRAIVGDSVSISHAGAAADAVDVTANGNDDNRASTVAGSGGLGSLVAANATTDTTTHTTAALGTAAGGTGQIKATRVDVSATQTARIDAEADSTNASAVGYSGAKATNTADTHTNATIGRNLNVQTEALRVTASNTITKPSAGYQVDAGAGGLLNGSAASSRSTLRNRASVDISDGATITIENGTDTGGVLNVAALNTVNAHDSVRLDSGGAIAIARSESTINNELNDGTVRIGSATIVSDGEINVSARTDADVNAETRSKTYGVAGAAEGRSRAYVKADNTVNVATGANIQAEHDVHLMAGTDRSTGNQLNADADTRLWNRTALPIENDPQAHGEINQHNSINVATGAKVRSVRSVHLTASEGTHTVRGFGEGTDAYREVLSAIGEFFGADTSSLKIRAGTTADNSNNPFNPGSAVNVDGVVEAGIWHHQFLTFNADDTAVTSEQVSYTLRDNVLLSDLLSAEITALRNRAIAVRNAATDYEGEVSAADYALALDNDADILEAQLAALGANTRVGFLDVNPILATTGNVAVTGDAMTGGGSLTAPGDVRIDVENRSTRFMTTSALTIPDDDGGKVLFNGRSVSSATDINARNALGKTTGVAVTSALNTAKPVIRIENTNDTDVTPNGAAQLWIFGDITNLRGLAQAKSHGTIRSSAKINAETVDIATGGDFIQTYTPGFTHQGGNPISQLGTLPDNRENAAIALGGSDSADSAAGDYSTNSTPHLCTGDRCSTTIAGNNVYISGEKLNINGLIQAGLPDRGINITNGLVSAKAGAIATAKAAYLANPDTAPQYLDLNAPDPASSDIKVRYDLANDRLELNNVRMGGGHMELFGNIFSTGNGQLKVLDGYGRITVNNTSNYDVVLNRLDTGPGVEGTIKITDLAKRVIIPGSADMSGTTNAGVPLVTLISRLGDAVVVKDSRTTDADGNPTYQVSSTTGRSGYYDPVANRRFNWINGRKQQWTEDRIYTKKILLGADWAWADTDDPDKITPGTPVYTDRLTGDWLSIGGGSDQYKMNYTQSTTGKVKTAGPTESNRVCIGFCDVAIYEQVTLTTTYKWTVYEYFNHSLNASNRIDINFTGYDTSNVTVNSTTGQVLFNGLVRSVAGDTLINAGGGMASLSDAGYIVGSNVILNSANGAVGTAAQPVRVDLTDAALGGTDGQIWINGHSGANVMEIGGDLRVAAASSATGAVSLSADRHLLTTTPTVTISGYGVNLVSESGDIANSGAPIRIDNLGDGVVSALANGDIVLVETAGDLRAGKIESQTGDVTLDVPTGNLVDANTIEQADDKTAAELLSLWDSMRLRGDPAKAAADETVANFEAGVKNDYRAYWDMRKVRNENGTWVADAYNPGFTFKLDTGTASALKTANGWNDADIKTYEAEQTAFYHDSHARFGGSPFNPGFTYTASTTEESDLRDGAVWTDQQLKTALSAGLFRPVTDTEITIEQANVIGRNVALNVAGSIGQSVGDFVIARGTNPDTLTDEEKLALLTAEARDFTLTDSEIRIRRQDDVDITASTGLTAIAGDKILLGSEAPVVISQVRSPGDVRIKSSDGISSIAPAGTAAIVATDMVLEGGQGGIGSALAPIVVDLADGALFDARARGDIFITELSGDMDVGTVYSQQDVTLSAPGAILDAGHDTKLNIQGHNVNLSAGTTIGIPADANGALEVNVARDGVLNAMAPLGIYLASVGVPGRIGDITTNGPFAFFANAGSLDVEGTVKAGSVTLGADDDVTLGAAASIAAATTVRIDAGSDGSGSVLSESAVTPAISAGTSVVMTAPDSVGGPTPISVTTPQLIVSADQIDVTASAPDASTPLTVSAFGYRGLPASDVKLVLDSGTAITIDTLKATTSNVTATTPLFTVLDGQLGDYAAFYTPAFAIRVDHHDRRFQPGFDVRAFTLSGLYDMVVTPQSALIGAYIITKNPRKVVFSNPGGVADLRSRGQLNALDHQSKNDKSNRVAAGAAENYATAAGGLVFVDPDLFDCGEPGEANACEDL